MDVDDDDNTQKPLSVPDFGIQVDFSSLDEEAKEDGGASMGNELQTRIESITAEIEKMSPNMKAVERLDDTEAKLAETEKEFEPLSPSSQGGQGRVCAHQEASLRSVQLSLQPHLQDDRSHLQGSLAVESCTHGWIGLPLDREHRRTLPRRYHLLGSSPDEALP